MTMRAIGVLVALGIVIGASPAGAQRPQTRQGRTAAGRALGYELSGAAIPEAALADVPDRVQTALGACATDAVPLIGATLQAQLTIAPAGTVSSVVLEGAPASGAAPARACVERALATLTFPRRRAVTTLTLELEIREARPAQEDPAVVRYRESVIAAMQRRQPAVHDCFERASAAHEPHDDRLRVELTIDAEGRLTRVAVPLGDETPRLTECLTREMRGWTVPRPPTAPFEMSHRLEGVVASYD